MERYWTLRYLAQNQITELDCAVMINGLVRADTLPLVFKAIGADSLPRHSRVRVRVTGVDELTLDVHASVTARLDEAPVDEGDADVQRLVHHGAALLDIQQAAEIVAAQSHRRSEQSRVSDLALLHQFPPS